LDGLGIIGLDTGQNSGVGLGMNNYTQVYAAFVTNKDDDLKALLTPDTLNHIYTVPGSTNKASLLGLAILLKRTELATYLVNQGADIAKVSDKGQSALFFAIRMYISLLEKGQDTTGMLAFIEFLMEKGADITPIMPIITSWPTKIAPTYDQDGTHLLALITSLNRKNIREQQARDEQAKEIELEQAKEQAKEQEKTDLVAATLLASALAPTPVPALAKASGRGSGYTPLPAAALAKAPVTVAAPVLTPAPTVAAPTVTPAPTVTAAPTVAPVLAAPVLTPAPTVAAVAAAPTVVAAAPTVAKAPTAVAAAPTVAAVAAPTVAAAVAAPTVAVAAVAPTVAALAKAPTVAVPDILVRSILLTARALASRAPPPVVSPPGPGSRYTPLAALGSGYTPLAALGSGYTPLPLPATAGPLPLPLPATGPLPLPAAAAAAATATGFKLPEFKFPELGSIFGSRAIPAAPAGRFLYSPSTALAATSRVTAANKALKEAVAAAGSVPTPAQLAEIARLRGAVEEAAAEKRATDDYVGSSLQRTQQRIKQYRAWMDTYKNNTISAQIDDVRDPMLRDYLELEERGDEEALARFKDRTILIDDVETTILNPYKAARYRGASDGSSFNSDGSMFAADNAVVQKLMPELVGDKRAVNAILESLWYCGTKQEIGSDPRCFPERYMGLLRKYGSKAVQFAPGPGPGPGPEVEEEAEAEAEAEEEAEAEYEELAGTVATPVLTPVLTPAQRAAEALRRRGAEGRAGAAARVRFAKTSASSVE
jgi:hypothetical protein